MARDRAEERLLLRQAPAPPPAGDAVRRLPGPDQGVVAMLTGRSGRVVVATDGAAEAGVATWAIADGLRLATGAVQGEDQSSFAAEVEAVRQVLQAAGVLPGDRETEVVVLVDSRATIDLYGREAPPTHAVEQWRQGLEAVATLRGRGIDVRWQWVPSHGRRAEGYRAPYIPEQQARDLNNVADRAARQALRERIARPERQEWCRQWRQAAEVSASWLRLATRIAGRLGVTFPDREGERRVWDHDGGGN